MLVCRICLRQGIEKNTNIDQRLIDIHEEELCVNDDFFDSAALSYCSICEYQLRKFYNFRQKCRRAQNILKTCKIKRTIIINTHTKPLYYKTKTGIVSLKTYISKMASEYKDRIVTALEEGMVDLGDISITPARFLEMFNKYDKSNLAVWPSLDQGCGEIAKIKKFLLHLHKCYNTKLLTVSDQHLNADFKCNKSYQGILTESMLDYQNKWNEATHNSITMLPLEIKEKLSVTPTQYMCINEYPHTGSIPLITIKKEELDRSDVTKEETKKTQYREELQLLVQDTEVGNDLNNSELHTDNEIYAENDKQSFLCRDKCNIFFSNRPKLASHLNITTKRKKYSCNGCDKAYNHKGTLKKIHTGEKPYISNSCDNAFNQKGHLHMIIHTREKPCT